MKQLPSSEDILSMEGERVASFIHDHADARTLSQVVKRLNHDLIAGDRTARRLAARALDHLGFVDTV